MNIEVLKKDIRIPEYVMIKMQELGITELPKIKDLAAEYIVETDSLSIDWWYFTNWVAMGYSDH